MCAPITTWVSNATLLLPALRSAARLIALCREGLLRGRAQRKGAHQGGALGGGTRKGSHTWSPILTAKARMAT